MISITLIMRCLLRTQIGWRMENEISNKQTWILDMWLAVQVIKIIPAVVAGIKIDLDNIHVRGQLFHQVNRQITVVNVTKRLQLYLKVMNPLRKY